MKAALKNFIASSPEWWAGDGGAADLILSSRARLARNLMALPFVPRTRKSDLVRVIHQVETAVHASKTLSDMWYFPLADMPELDRQFLMERRLISPALVEKGQQSGVFVRPAETASLMVNEEDHLRIQTIHGGLALEKAWKEADRIDSELSETLDYAFSDEFGYLTACPTNVGTGIRMSVLIHLPGLERTQHIEPVIRGMQEIGVSVRGLYGEGTGSLGNLYQVSNQWKLGYAEQEIINRLHDVVRQLMEYEHRAYEALLKEARLQVEDRIWRAYAMLKHARLLSESDALEALSMIRMGRSMQIFSEIDLSVLNRLFMTTQSAHVQKIAGGPLDTEERNRFRAEMVRQVLNTQI
ncbi:MAG: protein arginine kinase [candidate division Zixibacteria bacterium]|nr:protein arginine kinase [candidate division Zixibacteria bacterium]